MKMQVLAVLVLIGILPVFIFSRMLLVTYRNQALDQKLTDQTRELSVIANLVDSSGLLLSGDSQEFGALDAE